MLELLSILGIPSKLIIVKITMKDANLNELRVVTGAPNKLKLMLPKLWRDLLSAFQWDFLD